MLCFIVRYRSVMEVIKSTAIRSFSWNLLYYTLRRAIEIRMKLTHILNRIATDDNKNSTDKSIKKGK